MKISRKLQAQPWHEQYQKQKYGDMVGSSSLLGKDIPLGKSFSSTFFSSGESEKVLHNITKNINDEGSQVCLPTIGIELKDLISCYVATLTCLIQTP